MTAPYIPFTFPGVTNVYCLFSTKLAGNFSAPTISPLIAKNRRQLMEYGGFTEWSDVYQVHGDDCIEAEPKSYADLPAVSADGLYTDVEGRALVIKTADCQAILFAKKDGSAVGAIHAGWRGNRLHFPTTALLKFCQRYNCSPEEVVAVRGPSLGEAEFVNFHSEWAEEFTPWYNESDKTMDLWGLTRYQLVQAGVPASHIYGLDFCTLSHPDLFYSYRRADAERQVAVIWRG